MRVAVRQVGHRGIGQVGHRHAARPELVPRVDVEPGARTDVEDARSTRIGQVRAHLFEEHVSADVVRPGVVALSESEVADASERVALGQALFPVVARVEGAHDFARAITRAGTPATTSDSPTSRVTTAPAATSAASPMVLPAVTMTWPATTAHAPMVTGSKR